MYKIFLRNLVQITAPIILGLFVMGGIFLRHQYVQTVATQRQYTQNVLYQTQDAIEKDLNHVNTVAQTLSYYNDTLAEFVRLMNSDYLTNAQEREVEELVAVAKAAVASNLNVNSIYVYMENTGQSLYASEIGHVKLEDFYDQDWYRVYRDLRDSKSLCGFFHQVTRYQFEGPRDVVSVMRMLPTTQLRHRGAVVLNVDTKVFTSYLNGINLPADVQFLIRDAQKNVLFCYNAGDGEVTGEEVAIVSDTYGWEYVLYTSGLAIYQQFMATLRFILWITIISSVAGLIAAVVLTYRRMARLQAVFDMLEEHGYRLSRDVRSFEDEYGYLSKRIAGILLELGQQKYQMRVLQLEASQYQMTPHFLFNTLETLLFQCMDLTNSTNAASEMVSQLSVVLKYSMRCPDEQVPLQTELDVVREYSRIMRTRYSKKFALEFDVAPECMECSVPKMFVQPLVENSIYHGAREKEGFTTIRVAAAIDAGRLVLRVADDGAGITPERLASVRSSLGSQSRSIGLNNVYRRLETLYGRNFTMELHSPEKGGMEVYIAMPAEYMKRLK